MVRFALLGVVSVISAQVGEPASAEAVASHEFERDRSGYPCFLDATTDEGTDLGFQLSDYQDVWSFNIFVSNKAEIYNRFFDERGLRDKQAFEQAFSQVTIGETVLELDEVDLFEVQRQEVDATTSGIFKINEMHNVTRALEAMAEDGLAIRGLLEATGTRVAFADFRACAYEAMGLTEGEQVETDYRAEYRMIFEDAFEAWIVHMATAEGCLTSCFGDEAVQETIDRAAGAFYPGVFSWSRRSGYIEQLERQIPMWKLSGLTEAMGGSCFMVGDLARMARMPVDQAIEAAEELQ